MRYPNEVAYEAIEIQGQVRSRVVMEILGHDQISTTMNIYGHVLDTNKRDATAKIEELFGDEDESSEAQDDPQQDE
jgi:integrase